MSQTATVAPTGSTAADALVRRRLRTLWLRRVAQGFFHALGLACLLGSAALLVAGVVRFFQGEVPYDAALAWQIGEAALVGVVIYLLGSLPNGDGVAGWIDRRAGTHDRFHTALDFAARPERTPLQELTLAECLAYVERFPVARWAPLRLPRLVGWSVVPLVSLALLAWHGALGIGEPPRDPALQAAVAKQADTLQKVAAQLQAKDRKASPDLDKLAEAMKRSAERLKESQHQGDEQKLKTTLGELSSLEAMLNAMKQAAKENKVSPGELAALAAALEASQQGKDAAAAIKSGQLEQAGDQLQKLAEQLQKQGKDAQALQQLAQSMQEQAAKLSESEKNEVARQMQQAAQGAQSGQQGLSQKALQRLAELLKKAGKNAQASNGKGSNAPPMTEQQLQDLLNSLENMKEGLQPGGDPTGNGQGSPQSLASVEAFTKERGDGKSQGDKASGMPGGEHDQGTNDHLFADKPPDVKAEGNARRIEGALGDGQTLQELVGGNNGPAKASRRYRDLYEAIAPAEQNSVEQENIPLGSRHLVRRYFEEIRPQN